jgi:alpha-amylase/alpha-mannosidase (GH57 family)
MQPQATPRISLVFLWHMHQPFYKELGSNRYQLPWTRMHALKDYYGMVTMLEKFPGVKQTFNLVPSMLVQIDDYARGEADDPFLRRALTPAEQLSAAERAFILKYFFQANHDRLISRYPRYAELFRAWRENPHRESGPQDLRDLQVLSQLSWFDEIVMERDARVRALAAKGRGYTLEDQAEMGRLQRELLAQVIPAYAAAAARGQVEISVTPFYHPILPLLCDSDIARASHPGVPLPRRFAYPGDAEWQMRRALDYAEELFGKRPAGMWPSEGSVSDQTCALAAKLGIKWLATDNGVLGATLAGLAGAWETYRPYRWTQGQSSMGLLFRDHFLSDLIGFVYSRMEADQAAHHFLDRIRDNARAMLAAGRRVIVPIILDGENAWEHYHLNGRPFLDKLYTLIEQDPDLEAITVSEAFERAEATRLDRIHPGSWIHANFDIWIGAEEDNQAWEFLLAAREAYDRAAPEVSGEQRRLAWEELMIAEGSDWFWWYGPEHHSENRAEFDQLFRDHVASVYRYLGLPAPAELSRPILKTPPAAREHAPCGLIDVIVDGRETSYFEWMGAGLYCPDQRHGAMHGRPQPAQALHYGSDARSLFLRVDFADADAIRGHEVRIRLRAGGAEEEVRCLCTESGVTTSIPARAAFDACFECALPVESGLAAQIALQVSVWKDQLPLQSLPAQGWIEFVPASPAAWE